MKIINLKAENIKKVTAVEITPDGNMVVIGGKNGEGKSSVLDSIFYALGGKAGICSEPLRQGSSKGRVVCDLDDLTVTRTFTKKGGGVLTVANKDGLRHTSPQAVLDNLVGKIAFDPLEFTKMDSHKQVETLKTLVGLDFTKLDAQRKGLYDERTFVHKEGDKLKIQLDSMPDYSDVPDEAVSISNLMGELQRAQEQNRKNDEAKADFERLNEKAAQKQAEIEELRAALEAINTELKKRQPLVDSLEYLNTEAIQEEIANAEETNAMVRGKAERAEVETAHQNKQSEYKFLSDQIKEIDNRKTTTLASAKFPIPGLSFNDDNIVTYQGLPFDQASSAEQLRVSVAMGIAMNPKLRVLLIRDGSLLDEENLQAIAQMAEAADAQIWLERVGDGTECQVIIEDGHVKQ